MSTWPAFSGGFFGMNNDGDIHLARLASVYTALRAGHLPSLVNFIGLGHRGLAVNAMYPWVTLLIFVVPHLWWSNALGALAIGFFLLNLITIMNSYWLAKALTKQRWLRWFGVMLYQFNAYHFVVMYGRVALGEALGYAFLPLVMLGLWQIWQRQWRGTGWLALGMGLTANSHVLSLVMFTGAVVGLELVRLGLRHVTRAEVLAVLAAGGGAILMSLYSLLNVFEWVTHNQMVTPTPSLIPLSPVVAWQQLIQNDFSESANGAGIGLVASVILLSLVLRVFDATTGTWRYWLIGTLLIWLVAQNWWPWVKLANTPLQLVQFTMRFLVLVALGLMVATILYFEQTHAPSKLMVVSFSGLLMGLAIAGTWQLHSRVGTTYVQAMRTHTSPTATARLWHMTNQNYQANIDTRTIPDYSLKKSGRSHLPTITASDKMNWNITSPMNSLRAAFNTTTAKRFTYQHATDQQVTFVAHLRRSKVELLPVVGYANVTYRVTVNGRMQAAKRAQGQLQTRLPAGRSRVTISVAQSSRHGWLLALSGLASLAIVGGLWLSWYRPRH
ncbi:hypothetical protein DY78_GL001978 [Lactiplantibacillus fabifermentans DSM 21115]|uniref:Integral membrane protein n=1 Tax=Lactiplantibacillus fabifermentans DSM 21115 TaxID=1413187 RepID=A0A0R2NYY1_9LACO|nr:hypothetical protein DY78_GL001978 [Lactiplantibacillus fabifermentans DSM 21115]